MVDSRTDQLSGGTRTQLELAELYTMDLAESAHEQLELLRKLRSANQRNVSRLRAELGRRHLEALSNRFKAQRGLLKDLRAALRNLRRTLQASGKVPDRRAVERQLASMETNRPRRS